MIASVSPELHADSRWLLDAPSLLDAALFGDRLVTERELKERFAEATRRWRENLAAGGPRAMPYPESPRAQARLGARFEELVARWLREALGADPLLHGVIVREDRQVVGELDFVFGHPAWPEPQHWEISVKFYLALPATDARDGYAITTREILGTETRDRLDRKLRAVFGRQLCLAERPAARAALGALASGRPLRSRAWVKGMVFVPAGGPSLALPAEVAPDAWCGQWAEWGTEAAERAFASRAWVERPKARWLAPAWSDPASEPVSAARVQASLRDAHTALLLAEAPAPGSDPARALTCERRLLLVSPGWTERARRAVSAAE